MRCVQSWLVQTYQIHNYVHCTHFVLLWTCAGPPVTDYSAVKSSEIMQHLFPFCSSFLYYCFSNASLVTFTLLDTPSLQTNSHFRYIESLFCTNPDSIQIERFLKETVTRITNIYIYIFILILFSISNQQRVAFYILGLVCQLAWFVVTACHVQKRYSLTAFHFTQTETHTYTQTEKLCYLKHVYRHKIHVFAQHCDFAPSNVLFFCVLFLSCAI